MRRTDNWSPAPVGGVERGSREPAGAVGCEPDVLEAAQLDLPGDGLLLCDRREVGGQAVVHEGGGVQQRRLFRDVDERFDRRAGASSGTRAGLAETRYHPTGQPTQDRRPRRQRLPGRRARRPGVGRTQVAEPLTTGEVSRRSGVAASALRFYEERGLIASERAGSGHRRYARRRCGVSPSSSTPSASASAWTRSATSWPGCRLTARPTGAIGRGSLRLGPTASTSGSAGSNPCARPSPSASAAGACRFRGAHSPTPPIGPRPPARSERLAVSSHAW